jgi:hypothetical protein
VGSDDLFCAGEDLVEGHGGGVEDDGVGGGLEWGLGTVAVSIITFSEVADDGFLGLALALVGEGVGHLA